MGAGCSRIAWHVFIDMGILAGVALTAGRRRATEPSATQVNRHEPEYECSDS